MGNTGKTLPLWAINLKKYRVQNGLSQAEFGRRFGVTRMAVSYWESGQYEPPVRVLTWILAAAGQMGGSNLFFENGVMKDDVWGEDIEHVAEK